MAIADSARIRALDLAGKTAVEIASETGRNLRTVRSVLERKPSPWEVAEVDRLTGWAPLCMEPEDWADWQAMNPRISEAGGFAPRPCTDCPIAFADEMRAVGKCNGTPGQQPGIGVLGELDAATGGIRPRHHAPRRDAPIARDRTRRSTHKEPTMATPPPAPRPPHQEPADSQTAALGRLADAAREARDAREALELAEQAWQIAQDALTAAWREVKGTDAPASLDASGLVKTRATRAGPPTVAERAKLVLETLDRHQGNVSSAAAELRMRPNALARIANSARARLEAQRAEASA
jgi:hypothetical protein